MTITEDAQTVSVREALTRLENLGLGILAGAKKIIENIQRVRNRIEHHRYDHSEKEDDAVIAESLKFILYFVEFGLKRKLDDQIDSNLLREIKRRVWEYNERQSLAEFRFHEWLRTVWPDWKEEEDLPEEFGGTCRCPECAQDWLVIGWHDKPFCFDCNTTIDADECEHCGRTFLVKSGCDCVAYELEEDGRA